MRRVVSVVDIELEGIFVLPLSPHWVRHSYLSKEATIDPLYLWVITPPPWHAVRFELRPFAAARWHWLLQKTRERRSHLATSYGPVGPWWMITHKYRGSIVASFDK